MVALAGTRKVGWEKKMTPRVLSAWSGGLLGDRAWMESVQQQIRRVVPSHLQDPPPTHTKLDHVDQLSEFVIFNAAV